MIAYIQNLAATACDSAKDSSTLDACISALRNSIKALDTSIGSLEGRSPHWDHLAFVCSVVVVLGIAGELAVIVHEYRDEMHDWSRGIVRPPDRPSRKWFRLDVVATVVVLLGILGETSSSLELSSINSDLRSKTSVLRADSEHLTELVTKETGNAVASADRAQKSADKADTSAKGAENEARAASASATHLGELEDEFQKQTLEQQLYLAAASTNRPMDPLIFNSLSEEPQVKVTISCAPYTACDFAQILADTLRGMKWQVSAVGRGDLGMYRGIEIGNKWETAEPSTPALFGETKLQPMEEQMLMKKHPEMTKAQADRLLRLSIGLHAELRKDPTLDENSLEILVGPSASPPSRR